MAGRQSGGYARIAYPGNEQDLGKNDRLGVPERSLRPWEDNESVQDLVPT